MNGSNRVNKQDVQQGWLRVALSQTFVAVILIRNTGGSES